MPDRSYRNENPQMLTPFQRFEAVTPDDATDLSFVTRGVMVGGAGNLAVHDQWGNAVTLPVQAGVTPIQVRRILATGTTATNIVAAD